MKKVLAHLVASLLMLLLPQQILAQEVDLSEVIAILDGIATKNHEVEDVMISYLFTDEALQSREFVYILVYFETMGWNIYLFPMTEEQRTLIIFFTPQVAMLRSWNQNILATLFSD